MATQDIVGRDEHGAVSSDGTISLAKLVELCHEIDESWTEEEVKNVYDDFFLTDVGFLKLRPEGDWVQIDMIGVLPEERGKGNGRKLVEAAELVAESLDLAGVGVATINPEFFSHLGFKVMGMLPRVARGKDLTVMFKERSNVFDSKETLK